jgi:YHS domain-containing protein
MIYNLLRLALVFILLWLVRALYKAFREGTGLTGKKAGAGEIAGGRMVKDEICGTYIPVKEAIREKRGGETRYFCSSECRDKYLSGLEGAGK